MRANTLAASAHNFHSVGWHRSRFAVSIVTLCATIALLLAGSASSASGAAWIGAGSFAANGGGGAIATPTGIAINQATGNVYVSNLFSAGNKATTLLNFSLDGTAGSPSSFGSGFYDGVAVDPATGNIYGLNNVKVASAAGIPQIEPFTPAGVATGSPIQVVGMTSSSGGRTLQIASDAAGNVYYPRPIVNEVQTVTKDATGGTFKLSFEGQTTGASGTGDIDSSTTTVSNVTTATGAFVAGMAISGPGIAAGTTVGSVNPAAKTITLSTAPTETTSGVALTADLPFSASAANLANALQALPLIGVGGVAVTGGSGGPWTVTFQGAHRGKDVSQMTADASGLTGGASTVSVATPTTGSRGEVIKYSSTGVQLASLKGSGASMLENPHSVAIDNAGSTYVADGANAINEQQVVSQSGTGGTFELSFEGQTTGASGTGDIDSSTTTVSNVTTATGAFVAGMAISGPGIAADTTISSVNVGAKTVTLSALPTETKTAVALSADVPFDVSTTNLRNALTALSNVGTGNVEVNGSPTSFWAVNFKGALAGKNLTQMTANAAGLTGGTAAVTVTTNVNGSFSPGRVFEFDSTGAFDSVFLTGPVSPTATQPTGLGVNPANGNVFVVEGQGATAHVVALDSSGKQLADFGAGDFKTLLPYPYPQIAVDADTGRVYVTDPGAVEVQMYDPLPPPVVTTKAASSITATGATLNATVNASGLEADCEFEYDDNAGFTSPESVPCIPNPVIGDIDTPVTAKLTGKLSANTTYFYHVVAENEGGESIGSDLQFTSKANPPTAKTGTASAISQTVATLNGTVNASGVDASCKFEWGISASYGQSAPCSVDPVTGSTDTVVMVALSGLSAGTTYHYRVSATNSGGGPVNGGDQTFSTLVDTCATNAALCPSPAVLTPPATPPAVPPPTTKPLKCKKGFKKKAVKGKKKCVKVKKKRRKRKKH